MKDKISLTFFITKARLLHPSLEICCLPDTALFLPLRPQRRIRQPYTKTLPNWSSLHSSDWKLYFRNDSLDWNSLHCSASHSYWRTDHRNYSPFSGRETLRKLLFYRYLTRDVRDTCFIPTHGRLFANKLRPISGFRHNDVHVLRYTCRVASSRWPSLA